MKKYIIVATFFFVSGLLLSQKSEFKTYSNGLIYSEKTMDKLTEIVDSLNLKYKVCDFTKIYHSKLQTIGHRVRLTEKDAVLAKKDMERGISFEDFNSKYPKSQITKEVLIVQFNYIDYQDNELLEFSEINPSGYGHEIIKEKDFKKDLDKGVRWIFSYTEQSKYSEESVEAFYLLSEFKTTALNEKYSRMIGYADCLMDSSTTKFKDNMKSGWVELPSNWQNLPKNKQEKLLDEMRSTRVIGGCSQDDSPRIHAVNIAMLSAETTNWEVFLRAHLDIMNDKFERASDGSYAWAGRKTYIKELEELNINLNDLIFGISLRIEDPVPNHYYGSIGRLGRALSEAENLDEIETQLLEMIKDENLDDYNRILIFVLFKNYAYSIENEKVKSEKINILKESVDSMPRYLKNKMEFK